MSAQNTVRGVEAHQQERYDSTEGTTCQDRECGSKYRVGAREIANAYEDDPESAAWRQCFCAA